MKEYRIVTNAFSVLVEITTWFLHSINMVYYIYQCAYVEPSLYPKDKSQLIMVYNPFTVMLKITFLKVPPIAGILLRIFVTIFISDSGL